jgi:hypothetical protein
MRIAFDEEVSAEQVDELCSLMTSHRWVDDATQLFALQTPNSQHALVPYKTDTVSKGKTIG